MSFDAKTEELGLNLSGPGTPVANYIPSVRTGNLVFLSGHGPHAADGLVRGKVGGELSVEEGYAAARLVMIQLLGSLKAELGTARQS